MNPWSVEAGDEGVDYGKLIDTFGSTEIGPVVVRCVVNVLETDRTL